MSADRVQRAGVGEWLQLSGPLLAAGGGGRLRQGHLWELVRRLARTAGVGAWEQLSPHSLRHSAITFALDAGASLRDVQDYAGHKDPRTTRRYDNSRELHQTEEKPQVSRSWQGRNSVPCLQTAAV